MDRGIIGAVEKRGGRRGRDLGGTACIEKRGKSVCVCVCVSAEEVSVSRFKSEALSRSVLTYVVIKEAILRNSTWQITDRRSFGLLVTVPPLYILSSCVVRSSRETSKVRQRER